MRPDATSVRKEAESIQRDNTLHSFHEFPPRGVHPTPHSPGFGRAFSWRWLAIVPTFAMSACVPMDTLPWGVVIR